MTRRHGIDQSFFTRWWPLWTVTLLVVLYRLGTAIVADWFGDEAFYHWESLHPALAYSDLPGMTAWVIAAGEGLFGHSALAARSLFLISALLTQLLVMALANRLAGPRAACWSGWLMLLIPLLSLQGSHALPDSIILCLWAAQLLLLSHAHQGARWAWLLSGLVAALGLMTHLRYGVLLFGVTVTWLAVGSARQQLRQIWPWIAALIGLAGLLPMLWFEAQQSFAQLGFQLIDRHPWAFQIQGLLQPLIQALMVTPILYLLLLLAGWRARRSSATLAILAGCGLVPVVFYALAGLWADQMRFDLHWPAAAYLPLIILLSVAVVQEDAPKMRRWLSAGLLLSGTVTLIGMVLLWQLHTAGVSPLKGKWAARNLVGWESLIESIGAQRDQLVDRIETDSEPLMLFDHFMPAAQWVARHGDAQVQVMDHPMNHKHGRAVQLAIWQVDQASIPTGDWQGLLVVERRSDRFATQPAWLRAACQWLDLAWSGSHESADQAKWFEFYRVRPRTSGQCELGSFGYLDTPTSGSEVQGTVRLSGWVVNQDQGVASLVISLDGQPVPAEWLDLRLGLEHEGVDRVFPGLTDPDGPHYGFRADLDLSHLPAGPVSLEVHAIGHNGSRSRVAGARLEILENGPALRQ